MWTCSFTTRIFQPSSESSENSATALKLMAIPYTSILTARWPWTSPPRSGTWATLRERIWHRVLEKLVTDKPVTDLGHLLLFLTQPALNKWRWLNDRLFPSEAFLRWRYGHRWNTHPLLTRVCRPFSLLFQAVRL